MSNTLTTISATLLQDEVLPALRLGLLPLNAFSKKYEAGKPLAVGDTVKVNVVAAKTAGTFSSTFESGNSTVVGTSVTIAAPSFSSWYVNPKLEGIPSVDRFLAEGREAASAVAKSVLSAALAKFVGANIGAVNATDTLVQSAANYDVDDQADQWGMLKTKGVGSASAIHNIAYATALLKDAALQDKSASDSDMLRTGELPPILGMKQYYTDAFPTAVTNENTGVIFAGPESLAIAIGGGFAEPVGGLEAASGVREFPVTDPETGLTMMWRQWVNSATGEYWGAVYVMYGVSFLRNSATRILSA